MKRPVTIVGGGLAGLTLGIGLLRRDVPVSVWEAGAYPRHKVCGEFISGAGLECLEHLSLWDLLMKSGARVATTVLFASRIVQTAALPLPSPALCLSRHTLDHVLSRQVEELGGCLRVRSPWRTPFVEGTVRATGRRPCSLSNGWRWYGLKVHANNVALGADLEMHIAPDAYVGLCRLDNGQVNVCGLFRNRPGQVGPADAFEQLRGEKGSLLHHRLERAAFIQRSFCSIAGLELTPQDSHLDECRIGDALTMIPPITGNGMSLALESAQVSTSALVDYAEARLSWTDMLGVLRRRTQERFAERLFWARQSHRLLFSEGFDPSVFVGLTRIPLSLRLLFKLTR